MVQRHYTHNVLRRIAPPGSKDTHEIVARCVGAKEARDWLKGHWKQNPRDLSEYAILNLNTWQNEDLPKRPETKP